MTPEVTPIPVGDVVEEIITGPDGPLRLRIYHPEGSGPFPIHVHLHGGGWVLGSLDSHDPDCRLICREAETIVVAVDYRLAPEHRHPAALIDCEAALSWAARQADAIGGTGLMTIGGDSAGGNLAAAVCHRARGAGGPVIALQLLIYPVLDATMDTPSWQEHGEGRLLDRTLMRWFWDQYCPDPELRRTPELSPLHASSLAGLPATHILTAEYDPLRDEAERYGQRLAAAGVAVEVVRLPGLIHGFFGQMAAVPAARHGLTSAAAALRRAAA